MQNKNNGLGDWGLGDWGLGKWVLVIGGGIAVGVVLLGILVAVLSLWSRPVSPTSVPLEEGFTSNGEMIYYTGINAQGERIPFTGGPRWLYMHGGGCASCHGEDGRGGVPVMMGTAIPSDIRYHHLIEEEHEEGEEHPPYTDELIKRAITQGLDPAGKPLDLTMPRWQMSEEDLNDLLEFLKTLE